jgi:hypothetical protein
MISLGKWIKNNYKEIDLQKISLRCTEIQRTQTSLHGVIKGLLDIDLLENVYIPKANDDSLLVPKNCEFVNNILERSAKDYFNDLIESDTFYEDLQDFPPQRIADVYLTHFCNKIPLDSINMNCNDDIIYEYIETSFKLWEEQAKNLIRTDKILEIVFGRFVNDLEKTIENKNDIDIISVHDSSLAIVLAGLGTGITVHPSYASSIFLEVWKDEGNESEEENNINHLNYNKNEKKYIRIIFNNEICKTTIDSNENIPFEKLKEYFKILAISNEEIIGKCNMKNYKKHIENDLTVKENYVENFPVGIKI